METINTFGLPFYGKGGKIHIKKENRGKFTAAAKRAGKSVQAYASQILANKERYSPTLVKRANFARNAAKFKHEAGGIVTPSGQWEYPGQVTIIPSNEITMEGVNYPVVGVSNTGERKLMLPWMNYKFNGDYVTEYPLKHQTNPYIDLDTFSYNNKTYGNNRKFNMDNMKLLDEYFIGKGVPLNQRQAILFNVLQESGADTLDAHGNGYYGIMGWSKDRYDSIKDKSLLGQAEYLYNTLYNGNGAVDWNHGGKGSGYNSWTDAQNMFINGKTFDDINHALVYGYIRPSSDVRNYRTTNGSIYFQPKKLEGSFVPLPTVDNKITDYSRAMAKGLFEGNNIANIVGTTLGAASTLSASIGGAVRAKKQGNADINQDALEHNGATLENEVQLEHPERAIRTDNEVQMSYSSPLSQKLGSPIPFRYSWNQQGGMPSTQAIIEGGEIVDYPDGTQLIDTGEQHEYSGERTYRPDGKIDGDPVEFTGIPMVDLKNNPNLKLFSFGANPWAQGEPFIWPSTVNQHGYVNTKVDNYFPKAHQENEINFAQFGGLMQQPFKKPARIKRK